MGNGHKQACTSTPQGKAQQLASREGMPGGLAYRRASGLADAPITQLQYSSRRPIIL